MFHLVYQTSGRVAKLLLFCIESRKYDKYILLFMYSNESATLITTLKCGDDKMEQHYFIGIPMPPSIHDLATTLQRKHQLHNHYKVLPHREDFHITLAYLGPLATTSRHQLTQQLLPVAKQHHTFSIDIGGLQFFGSPKGPRVIYLSIAPSEKLMSLQRSIAQQLQTCCNIQLPTTFTPHVTIAKKRRHSEVMQIEQETFSPITVSVNDFRLFSIHPHASPKYEAVTIYPLQD